MRGLAICVFVAACAACATPKVMMDHQRDSVAVIVRDSLVVRDSLIYVEIPMGSDKAVLPDSDTSRLETDIAESVAYVTGGKLRHYLRNKGEALIPVTIKVPERIHTEKEVILQAYKVTEIEYVEKELSKWQRFLQSIGWTIILGLGGYIIIRVIRFFS